MEEERESAVTPPGVGEREVGVSTVTETKVEAGMEEEKKPPAPKRFHGSVKIDPIRINRDAPTVSQEVIQHLLALNNARVEVTLEIVAEIPDGAPQDIMRTVCENCSTLKFDNYGFEEE